MDAMGEVSFNLTPVDEKPTRRYRKGSKYDQILDAFVAGSDNLVSVEIPDKDATYVRTQLNKRIDAKNLKVQVSVINKLVYLEK